MCRIFSSAGVVLLYCLVSALPAQDYPPTVRIPVTFYDFHADGSNPDFEPGLHLCGTIGCITGVAVHPNEVADSLDAEKKPLLGTSPCFSHRVAKWFRPWQAGDFTVPVYTTAGAYLRDATVGTDTAYINSVIPDTLTFSLSGGDAYILNSTVFFVLDGRGFGADDPGGQVPPHNFSFTMEMHYEFTFRPGLTITFSGDDDVWIFINGRMVIDLGGMHGYTGTTGAITVNLDTLPGMTASGQCRFDMFYAERHVTGSDIYLLTNIFAPPATSVSSNNGKIGKSGVKENIVSGFYTLCGQKISKTRIAEAHGIVLARTVSREGMVSVKKMLSTPR